MALDKHSPDVFKFRQWIDGELDKKRNALERSDKDAVATAFLRGYIKGLRNILSEINGDDDEQTG